MEDAKAYTRLLYSKVIVKLKCLVSQKMVIQWKVSWLKVM